MITKNNSDGFSLIGMMVALGIMGIVAKSMSSYFSNQYAAVTQYSLQSDKEEIRRWVNFGTDCAQAMTLLKNKCNGSKYVAIPGHTPGGTLVIAPTSAGDYTKVGGYYVKANCTANSGKTLLTFNFVICKTTDSCQAQPEAWKSLYVSGVPFECSSN